MTDPNTAASINEEEMVVNAGSFGFSSVPIGQLEEMEYCLVTILVDASSSVGRFRQLLIDMIANGVKSCDDNPRSENLLVRVCTFSSNGCFQEIHGFKPLEFIKTDVYNNIHPGGMTAASDAIIDAIGATRRYADDLWNQQDIKCNAHITLVTDGCENDSSADIGDVAALIKEVNEMESKSLESLFTLLIAVGTEDRDIAKILDGFHKETGFDQFLDAKDASADNMSKAGGWITSSVSSSVRVLGSGTKSTLLQV